MLARPDASVQRLALGLGPHVRGANTRTLGAAYVVLRDVDYCVCLPHVGYWIAGKDFVVCIKACVGPVGPQQAL